MKHQYIYLILKKIFNLIFLKIKEYFFKIILMKYLGNLNEKKYCNEIERKKILMKYNKFSKFIFKLYIFIS